MTTPPPASKPKGPLKPQKVPDPAVPSLNPKIVESVQFTNAQVNNYAGEAISTPPDIMVSTTAGLAVQDAQNYMNAIMQIAIAGQAVAVKQQIALQQDESKAMTAIQKMVTSAVEAYGTVSSTAGESAQDIMGVLGKAD
ncbi:MAG: hypothetical protein HWE23_01240 [Rhodobacteraceae bacterium]|nr:hypothetical protein [Paracoccaceae bacterium]